jgi:hypothetical protein
MVAGLLLTGRELAYLPSMCKEGPGFNPQSPASKKLKYFKNGKKKTSLN